MRQYTTQEQTSKLIELGFEKPKSETEETLFTDNFYRPAYSIGELIEMLNNQEKLTLVKLEHKWYVNYHTKDVELIDALYEMILKLKEEGMI